MSWKATAATKPLTHDRRGRKLNQGEKLVLILLADSTDPRTERAYPSQKTLAAQALCSERTVQRHLKELQNGLLLRVGGPGGRGGYWYELTYVKPEGPNKGDKMTPFPPPEGGQSSVVIPPQNKGDKMTPLLEKKGDTTGQERRHHGSGKATQLCRVTPPVSIYEPKEPKEPNKNLPVPLASSDSSEGERHGKNLTPGGGREEPKGRTKTTDPQTHLRRELEAGISRGKLLAVFDDCVIAQDLAGGGREITEAVACEVVKTAVTLLLTARGFTHLGGGLQSAELEARAWPRIARALPTFGQIADYTKRKHQFGASVINCVVSAALELRGKSA